MNVASTRYCADVPAADIFEWEVRNWSQVLPLWQRGIDEDKHRPDFGGTALEIGGRGGGLSLWLALQGYNTTCSYYGTTMNGAKRLHRQYGVDDRIDYAEINALEIPWTDHFDVVILKSVIGAVGAGDNMDRQLQMVEQIRKCLKPGGRFLFVENIAATPVHRYFRQRKRGDSWRYPTIVEISKMLASFQNSSLEQYGFTGCFGQSENQRDQLARLDAIIQPLIPRSWKYIIGGVAQK